MTHTNKSRCLSVFLTAALVATATGPLSGCTGDESEAGTTMDAPRDKPRVQAMTVTAESFQSTAILTGTTEADEVVRVSAEMPGRVLSIGFEEGAEVKKGATLIRVDARTDRAMLGQYRVQRDQANKDLARTKDLHGRGLATDADVERAETQYKMASSSVRMAQTGVGKSTVDAPITGIVDTAHVRAGEYVNPGAPIATIVNFDKLLVRVPLPESMLLAAKPGSTVQVRFPALKRSLAGKVKRVGVQAHEGTRTFPMFVEIDNADHALRPGLRAAVTLVTAEHSNAVLIPRDAVIEGIKDRYVFLLDGDRAKRAPIQLGDGQADRVQVLEGVAAGDKLIHVGHRDLADQDEVLVLGDAQ